MWGDLFPVPMPSDTRTVSRLFLLTKAERLQPLRLLISD